MKKVIVRHTSEKIFRRMKKVASILITLYNYIMNVNYSSNTREEYVPRVTETIVNIYKFILIRANQRV